jgi:Ni/Fe-hydrogenase subunit HybB-like protein
MSAHVKSAPVKAPYFTPGVYVIATIAALGWMAITYRMLFGMGAATNMTDEWPWGIAKAINVAGGVALAAGGFTTAALAHIFHRTHYERIMRRALVIAMLGYTFVVLGLLTELGRYWAVWHPMLPSMWQGNSVLFEVAMCVMAYLTVLYLEFMPAVCERFAGKVDLPGLLAMLNRPLNALLNFLKPLLGRIMFFLIIAGVVLSCMHQSSLGALMLIAPYKIHPLWYTPIMPLLFLLSAMAVGYPMVILESYISNRSFGRKVEMDVLMPLSRFSVALVGLYLMVKVGDLFIRGAHVYLFELNLQSVMFLIELSLFIVPVVLLSIEHFRRVPQWLFASALMIAFGVGLNRFNVFLVAYQPPYTDYHYYPTVLEVLMTVGLIATLALVYRALVLVFPILPVEATESATIAAPAQEHAHEVRIPALSDTTRRAR